jgi:hypothetical protein
MIKMIHSTAWEESLLLHSSRLTGTAGATDHRPHDSAHAMGALPPGANGVVQAPEKTATMPLASPRGRWSLHSRMRHVLSSSDHDLAHTNVSMNKTSEPIVPSIIEKRVRAQTMVTQEDSRESLEAKVMRLQKQNAALQTQVSSLAAERDAWRSECFRQLNGIDSVCQMIDGIQEDNRAQVQSQTSACGT